MERPKDKDNEKENEERAGGAKAQRRSRAFQKMSWPLEVGAQSRCALVCDTQQGLRPYALAHHRLAIVKLETLSPINSQFGITDFYLRDDKRQCLRRERCRSEERRVGKECR